MSAGSRFSFVDASRMLTAGFCLRDSSFATFSPLDQIIEIWCRSMLILIILLLLLFGGGFFGFSRYGSRGGLGIGGIILLILILWLVLGGGLANLRL